MHAAKLAPKDRDIRDELVKLKELHAAQKREERDVYGGMFAKAAAKEPSVWAPKPKPARPALAAQPAGGMYSHVNFAQTAFGRREE